jgi:RNA polymerase sigma-70 factor (ECF subfamily)
MDQRQLFNRYHGRLQRFFLSRRFTPDEASDLTQEALLRVFKYMENLRTEASIDSWVLRVAANLWKNELRFRAAARRAGMEVSLEAAYEEGRDAIEAAAIRSTARQANALEQVLAAEKLDVANSCLDELPPGMRRCLLLHVHQDRKYQEIADLLRLSIDTVKSHIHSARRQLRACIERKLAGVSA